MTEGTIVISGKERTFKFGMRQARFYMRANKLAKVSDYFKEVATIGDETIEGYGVISKLLRSALQASGNDKGIPDDNDDLLDEIFASGGLQEILNAFTAAMPKMQGPQPDPSGK